MFDGVTVIVGVIVGVTVLVGVIVGVGVGVGVIVPVGVKEGVGIGPSPHGNKSTLHSVYGSNNTNNLDDKGSM